MYDVRIKFVFFLCFDILPVHVFIQQNTLGAMKVLWKVSKMLAVRLATFSLNTDGERIKCFFF